MDAPAWLERALSRCWLCCPGCGPVTLSTRFGPVDEDDPDGPWDHHPVIHHGQEGCAVLDDAAAQDNLGNGLLKEIEEQVDCRVRLPGHTDMAAP